MKYWHEASMCTVLSSRDWKLYETLSSKLKCPIFLNSKFEFYGVTKVDIPGFAPALSTPGIYEKSSLLDGILVSWKSSCICLMQTGWLN